MKYKIHFLTLLLASLLLVGFSVSVSAAQKTLPPFEELNPTSVKAANSAADKSYVTLTGKITKKYDAEEYMFQDSTGTIKIEFDDDYIPIGGFNVGTKMKVVGEIDKDMVGRTLEVKNYKLLK